MEIEVQRGDLKTKEDYNGEKYGWGRVLDYIGIPWRDPAHWWLDQYGKQITGQMNIFDFIDEE